MKEQIQQLIADGRTEEALDLLEQTNSDAVLLKARYSNGKKQYNMGLIDFGEWNRVQNQVNYAALEMAGNVRTQTPAATSPGNPASQPAVQPTTTATRRLAFISYGQKDGTVARQVCSFLETNEVDVLIDEDDLPAGKSIMEFIQEGIRTSDAVVSIISSQSLQSGWAGQESVAIMYAVWLAEQKFIPVRLDDVAFDIDFQIAAQEAINQKIKEMDVKIKKLRQLGGDARAFEDDRNRLFELKNNLGPIIQRLRNVRTVDISGDNFAANMPRVVDRIRRG